MGVGREEDTSPIWSWERDGDREREPEWLFQLPSPAEELGGHVLQPQGATGRRGEVAVNHLRGSGLGQRPHANYLSESLKVWSRHKEARCLPQLP